MAWRRTGDKPLPESVLTQVTDVAYICVTKGRWVNTSKSEKKIADISQTTFYKGIFVNYFFRFDLSSTEVCSLASINDISSMTRYFPPPPPPQKKKKKKKRLGGFRSWLGPATSHKNTWMSYITFEKLIVNRMRCACCFPFTCCYFDGDTAVLP